MQSSPLVLTIRIAVLATIISVILGIGAAWLVHRMKRGQGLVDGLFTLPMVLPPTVVGFGLLDSQSFGMVCHFYMEGWRDCRSCRIVSADVPHRARRDGTAEPRSGSGRTHLRHE